LVEVSVGVTLVVLGVSREDWRELAVVVVVVDVVRLPKGGGTELSWISGFVV